jgi:hypothetical protein
MMGRRHEGAAFDSRRTSERFLRFCWPFFVVGGGALGAPARMS